MKSIATEKECLLEIERLARLICDYRQDEQSLQQCVGAFRGPLNELAKIRESKEQLKQARQKAKAAQKKR